MGRRKRRRVECTDDWEQPEILCAYEEQRDYERIRPLVLFGEPVPERAAQTGTSERTLYRRIAAFEEVGAPLEADAPPSREGGGKGAEQRELCLPVRDGLALVVAAWPAGEDGEVPAVAATEHASHGRPADGAPEQAF